MALPTSAAFRRYYLEGRVPLVRAVLRLADDTTVQVGGDRIMNGGLSVTGATSPASDFSIGSAIVGTATVTLANYDGWLDLIDLEGATLLAYAGAEVAGGTEWALLGTYDVDAPTTRGMTCPVQCRDWMGRFEVPYGDVSTVYPATLATIVSDICTHVGVTLATPTFTNSSHVVQARPTDELSCIDMLGFVAQLACSFARMTPDGQLALGWYDPDAFGGSESWLDGGTFSGSQTPYADGDAANGGAFMTGGDTASGGTFADAGDYANVSAIRSLTVGAMDVTITGLRVTAQDEVVTEGEGAEGESYLYGQDGYVLSVENNPLVPYGTAQAVAGLIAPHVVGLVFRTVEADVIGDPSLVAGDAMVVTDRLGRTYRTYVTQATWTSGGSQRLACGAQPPSRRAMSRTGVVTRAISSVKEAVRRVTTATQAARQVADEARSVADAIGQHFWAADDGVHVTQVTQESWETSPVGHNLLANSLGILLRIGLNNLVSYTQGATAFYDGLGNAAANIVAQYGRDGAYQYVRGKMRTALTAAGLDVYDANGATSVASFNEHPRVGAANALHMTVGESYGDGHAVSLSDNDGNDFMTLEVSEMQAGDESTPMVRLDGVGDTNPIMTLNQATNDDATAFLDEYEMAMTLHSLVIDRMDENDQQTQILRADLDGIGTDGSGYFGGSVTASGGLARLFGTQYYIYLGDDGQNYWRFSKTSAHIQRYDGSSWVNVV